MFFFGNLLDIIVHHVDIYIINFDFAIFSDTKKCRIAFHGNVISKYSFEDETTPKVKVFKQKEKEGIIDRVFMNI